MTSKIKISTPRITILVSFLALAVFIQSCSDSEGNNSVSESKGTENPNLNISSTTKLFESPNITAPEQFLPYIQEAIKLDTLELLKALCHPDESRIRYTNAHTVCGIRTADMVDIDKFRRWFSPASLTGDITIDVDTAYLPTVLGDNERYPIVILEKKDERWYLVGMEWKK